MFDKITINKVNAIIEINDTAVYNINQIISFKKLSTMMGKDTVHKLEIVTVLGSNVFAFESLKKRDEIYKELKKKFELLQ